MLNHERFSIVVWMGADLLEIRKASWWINTNRIKYLGVGGEDIYYSRLKRWTSPPHHTSHITGRFWPPNATPPCCNQTTPSRCTLHEQNRQLLVWTKVIVNIGIGFRLYSLHNYRKGPGLSLTVTGWEIASAATTCEKCDPFTGNKALSIFAQPKNDEEIYFSYNRYICVYKQKGKKKEGFNINNLKKKPRREISIGRDLLRPSIRLFNARRFQCWVLPMHKVATVHQGITLFKHYRPQLCKSCNTLFIETVR